MEGAVGLVASFAGLLALSGTIFKTSQSFYCPIKEFDQELQSINRDIAQIECYLKAMQPLVTTLEESPLPQNGWNSTVRKMRKALLTLPPGIDDAFDDAQERIERKDQERKDNLKLPLLHGKWPGIARNEVAESS